MLNKYYFSYNKKISKTTFSFFVYTVCIKLDFNNISIYFNFYCINQINAYVSINLTNPKMLNGSVVCTLTNNIMAYDSINPDGQNQAQSHIIAR